MLLNDLVGSARLSSIDVMEREIQNQIRDLPRYAAKLQVQNNHNRFEPSKVIFTGSGDSFACALFAQALSKAQSVAIDPYELTLQPERLKGKTLVIISVSGRTKTNLALAKLAAKYARTRIAVTADPNSPLSKACDHTVEIEYEKLGVLTSGTVSFASCLLAVSSLLYNLPHSLSVKRQINEADKWTDNIRLAGENFLFVGSGLGRGLSAYGASKISEVLGLRADYEFPEQVGHSRLFSLRKHLDSIICLGLDEQSIRLSRILQEQGFRVYLIKPSISDPVLAALEVGFYLQHFALGLAKKLGLKECAFLTNRKLLDLSNRLIY